MAGKNAAVPPLPTGDAERTEIRDRLVSWYARLGTVAGKLGRMSLAAALTEQSEPCADAWLRVAEKNASVRKFVFMVSEGNAWVELLMAHAPILLATLPESALDRLMTQFTSALFSADASTELPADDNPNGDGGQSH